MTDFQLVEAGPGKGAIAEQIMRSLPDWFGIESSILQYREDVDRLPTLFCVLPDGDIAAFLTLHFHNVYSAELHVLGVLPQFHRMGFGKALVQRAEELSRDAAPIPAGQDIG